MGRKVQLREICYARSGDKGDVCNVGLMAKNDEAYKIIKQQVTAERVKEHFKGIVKGNVERYDLDNLQALNFVLRNALGGGATRTLMMDQTGKAFGCNLLRLEVELPD
ncbi:MAG: hypothetical protein Q8P59_04550 [Dehalococcoidia bacterium]|nr:hypothetical protein [Dehalococcoidia bacterium]